MILVCCIVCRYNQINKDLRDQVMQQIISGEFEGGYLSQHEKMFSKEKSAYEKTKVIFVCCF